MMTKRIFTFLAVAMLSPFASAQNEIDNNSVSTRHSSTQNQRGWLPGISVGVSQLEQSGDVNHDGGGVNAQVIGTYYFPRTNWLADAGLGFHQQFFEDEAGRDPFLGLISLSGRYILPQRWSFGPTAQAYFGNGDVFGRADDIMPMIGAVGFKEITMGNDQLVRLGLRYTSEVGSTDQNINILGFTAEWAVGSQNSAIRSASITAAN